MLVPRERPLPRVPPMSDKTVGDLRPAPYNPRKISKRQAQMLAKSLAEFGDLSGIVVNRKTGNVVGGHQRLKLFDPKWPIIKVEQPVDAMGTVATGHIETPWGRWSYRDVEWPEGKEKAANIAANKQGGDFSIPELKELLVELDDGGFDLDLTGFDEGELKDLIDWQRPGEERADEVPEPPKVPVTKPGDLWVLGNHQLLCGDSTKAEEVARLMK